METVLSIIVCILISVIKYVRTSASFIEYCIVSKGARLLWILNLAAHTQILTMNVQLCPCIIIEANAMQQMATLKILYLFPEKHKNYSSYNKTLNNTFHTHTFIPTCVTTNYDQAG